MEEFMSFVADNSDALIVGGSVFVLILMIGFGLHKARKVPGEEPMNKETYVQSKRQQRRKESSIVSDGIEAMLLDMFAKGHIDEDRYNTWRTRFRKRMGLIDLINKPITLTADMRKKNAKARIELLKKQPQPKLVKEKAKAKNKLEEILNGAV